MKGQYLAVESIFTFAMGISLAIGVLTIFQGYQRNIQDITAGKEVNIASLKVENAIYDLKNAFSGRKEISLPEEIGGEEYKVALERGVKILTETENYSSSLNNLESFRMTGTVEGGKVILSKRGKKYILRSG